MRKTNPAKLNGMLVGVVCAALLVMCMIWWLGASTAKGEEVHSSTSSQSASTNTPKSEPPAPTGFHVSVEFLAPNGEVSAGEPVLASVTLRNDSESTIDVLRGNEAAPTVIIQVTDQNGKVLASTPDPQRSGDGMVGIVKVPARSQRIYTWVVSGLYEFTSPGLYAVKVSQMTDGGNWASGEAVLRVIPRDPKRLDAACAKLLPLGGKPSPLSELPVSVRATALYAVNDDAVLPYLDWMAREWDDKYACLAMRRLGTEKSLRLLNALASRADGPGKAARNAQRATGVTQDVFWRIGYE